EAFDHLLGFAAEGGQFVFGDLMSLSTESGAAGEQGLYNSEDGLAFNVFFFNVLIPIIFISAIIGILSYIRVLPFIIKAIGILMARITGMPYIYSYKGAAAVFRDQFERILSFKN